MIKIAGIVYLIMMAMATVFQQKTLFWNKALAPNYQYQFEGTFKEVWLRPDSLSRLNTLYFSANTTTPKGIVLYFHGNADNLVRWGKFAKDFTKNGYDVLMYDYPKFGKSKGKLNEKALNTHADFLYQYALKYFPAHQIVIFGRSLGSGIASQLASKKASKMLLLETPFTSLVAVNHQHLPIFPYRWMYRTRFYTDRIIAEVKCPVHIFHGTSDRLIPYQQSLTLCKILGKSPSEILTTIPGGTHKNLGTFSVYHTALDSCLAQ
jgi:alpha-beta hydrolase superfamily lysophospholipase